MLNKDRIDASRPLGHGRSVLERFEFRARWGLSVGFCNRQKNAIVNGHRTRKKRRRLPRKCDALPIRANSWSRAFRGSIRGGRRPVARLQRDARSLGRTTGHPHTGVAHEDLTISTIVSARSDPRLLRRVALRNSEEGHKPARSTDRWQKTFRACQPAIRIYRNNLRCRRTTTYGP